MIYKRLAGEETGGALGTRLGWLIFCTAISLHFLPAFGYIPLLLSVIQSVPLEFDSYSNSVCSAWCLPNALHASIREHFLSSVRIPGSVVPRLQSYFTYTVVMMKQTELQAGSRSRKRCKKGGPAKIYWNLPCCKCLYSI